MKSYYTEDLRLLSIFGIIDDELENTKYIEDKLRLVQDLQQYLARKGNEYYDQIREWQR